MGSKCVYVHFCNFNEHVSVCPNIIQHIISRVFMIAKDVRSLSADELKLNLNWWVHVHPSVVQNCKIRLILGT